MRKRQKRANRHIYYSFTLCVICIISLGMVGIGYGAWNETLNFVGTATAGCIEPVFINSNLFLHTGNENWIGNAVVSNSGKEINVNINKAFSRDMYYLDFEIKNEGTLPIQTEVITETSGTSLKVQLIKKPKKVIEAKETTEGRLKIMVENAKYDCDSSFMVQLIYSQLAAS
ncbi:MAG: hypothetical protein PHD60_09400 [Clostridia bacterium]|nr:hypothetical protein [Clostridia bacterium]